MSCPDENTILEFLRGKLSDHALAALEAHLDTCPECLRLVADLARRSIRSGEGASFSRRDTDNPGGERTGDGGEEVEPGTVLERYVVLSRVGSGGMGVVYAAWDPDLNRKVALKLVRTSQPDRDADARSRLLREAQAMAQLSHPNVIPVYDVGTVGVRVFLAMEFVEGATLTSWMREKHRGWRELLPVFIAAGRGLQAAHQVGLVHRDFKPDNVLVGRDGRVRVTDFGLARPVESEVEAGIPPAVPSPASDLARLTGSGAVLGTPAYMAPEQYRGEVTDARTDQFAFCVALYEALHGARPFVADSYTALREAVLSGSPEPPPRESRVPTWLRTLLIRGLSARRTDRHASMDDLLEALSADPGSRRRRLIGTVAAAILIGLGVFGFFQMRAVSARLCEGAGRKLSGVWDPGSQLAVRAAFMSTNKPYAQHAWERVERSMNTYARDWVSMHTEACRATRIHGEQSEDMLDLRMGCLRRRLDEMQALSSLLSRADADVVLRSLKAVNSLGELRRCADTHALASQVPPPADSSEREAVERQRARLAEARANQSAGRFKPARKLAAEVVEAAREIGYRPLLAEALLSLGDVQGDDGDAKLAEESLNEALMVAEEVGDDETSATAWASLAWIVGYRLARYDEGLRLGRHAEAIFKRVGTNSKEAANLHNAFGGIYMRLGKPEKALVEHERALEIRKKSLESEKHQDVARTYINIGVDLYMMAKYDQAVEYYRRALELLRELHGHQHPMVAVVLNSMGNVHYMRSKYKEAETHYRQALQIREQSLGPEHPDVGTALDNVGLALWAQGELREALGLKKRGLSILEKSVGPDHPKVAVSLGQMAAIFRDSDDLPGAIAALRRALAINEKKLGDEHADTGRVMTNLGGYLMKTGALEEAGELIRRGLVVRKKAMGPDHPRVAPAHASLGSYLRLLERIPEARQEYQRCLEIYEKHFGPDHHKVAQALAWIAETYLDEKLPHEALENASKALTIMEKHKDDPDYPAILSIVGRCRLAKGEAKVACPMLGRAIEQGKDKGLSSLNLAEVRFSLARCLWATGGDRERARQLAGQAREAYLETGWNDRPAVKDLDAWLSRHRAAP